MRADYCQSGAVFSGCGSYRYLLSRPPAKSRFGVTMPLVFCMLNPSTADASNDDPTIRRCRAFAEREGRNGIVVVNLYALRSTDPQGLWAHADPVGPKNDAWLGGAALETGRVVCAWGANARPERVRRAVEIFRSAGATLWCLGTTKGGHPRHPLYVRGDSALIPWGAP